MEKGEERKIIIAESHRGNKRDPNCVFPFQNELDTRKKVYNMQ